MENSEIEIVKKVAEIALSSFICPVVIAYFTARHESKRKLVDEEREKLPNMFIIKLNDKSKVHLNEASIRKGGKIIQIDYKEYAPIDGKYGQNIRSNAQFKEITYEKLESLVKQDTWELIGFEDFSKMSLHLTGMLNKNNSIERFDFNKIPVLMTEQNKYCFVYKERHIPLEIQCQVDKDILTYSLKGRTEGIICPKPVKN